MTTERWTDESLDRFASTITTAIVANNEAIAASNERLTRIEQLQESNARSIQAMLDSAVEDRHERHELREATIRLSGVAEGIANLLASLDSDRPTILRKLSAIENKVDRILEKEDRQIS